MEENSQNLLATEQVGKMMQKYAMSIKGFWKPCVRLPLVEVTDSAKKIIENALKECNL